MYVSHQAVGRGGQAPLLCICRGSGRSECFCAAALRCAGYAHAPCKPAPKQGQCGGICCSGRIGSPHARSLESTPHAPFSGGGQAPTLRLCNSTGDKCLRCDLVVKIRHARGKNAPTESRRAAVQKHCMVGHCLWNYCPAKQRASAGCKPTLPALLPIKTNVSHH